MCILVAGKGAEMRDSSKMGTPRFAERLGDINTGDDELLYRWEEYRWEDKDRE